MRLDKKLYKKLTKYDDKLRAAVGLDFVRLDLDQKEEMAILHTEAYGSDGNIRGGCNRCVLNAVKRLGRDYLADKAEYQKKGEELAKAKKEKSEKAPKTPTPEEPIEEENKED